jgi:small ligand-binding sensory domain FIST
MAITAAEDNVIHELASRPALDRLKTAITELDELERALAAQGLLIGIVIDENRPEYLRGDFLVRGLLGADEETGSISVGERVRVGQTVRMHVRDGASADEDLREALTRVVGELDGPPAGALLFTCNGRGTNMFAAPNHDAAALEEAFGGVPAAGFFCAGEIGPVGARNFVHGFTATLAVFAS